MSWPVRLRGLFFRYEISTGFAVGALYALLVGGCEEPRFGEREQPDASLEQDGASAPDAEAADGGDGALAEVRCFDDPNVLGAECKGVVRCTSVGLCDLTESVCCVSDTTASCMPRVSCGLEKRVRCDGPEDCPQGETCCMEGGATSCVAGSSCNESQRLCHSDADCTRNRCLEGVPGTYLGIPVLFAEGSGVCRGL